MPYEWRKTTPAALEQSGAVLRPPAARECQMWPYRSLPRRGFVLFVGATAALLSLPLLSVLGSPVLWALLPFLLAALAGLWWGLARSYRSGETLERLRISADRVHLERHEPGHAPRTWQAEPHWVRVHLLPHDGPVANYLTLTGGGREVELGAFLTPQERAALHGEILRALRDLSKSAP